MELMMKIKLIPCPLCGYEEFDTHDGIDSQTAAIYCQSCPYGVEDSKLTLEELIVIHNTRMDKNSNRYTQLNISENLVVVFKEDMREGTKNLLGKRLNKVLDREIK